MIDMVLWLLRNFFCEDKKKRLGVNYSLNVTKHGFAVMIVKPIPMSFSMPKAKQSQGEILVQVFLLKEKKKILLHSADLPK